MRPLIDPPKLESSSLAPLAANDCTTALLLLDTDGPGIQLVIDEASARDLYHELAVFLGYDD